jgi:hypothetical protein
MLRQTYCSSRRTLALDTMIEIVETDLKRNYLIGVYILVFFLAVWYGGAIPSHSYAQASKSDDKIPEKGAICELDEREFKVENRNSGVLLVHRIFRIYNETGKEYGVVIEKMNKFIKVNNLKAQVRSFDGKLIKELQKDDVKEAPIFFDYILYRDTRVKGFDLSTTTFPYILEYSYEVKYKSLFFWPDWFPQMEIPVERSLYALTVPKSFAFKMQKRNLQIEPVEKQSRDKRQLIFELGPVPPFKQEKNMPPEMDHLMYILFAPDEFDLGGYPGSTSSWEAFGEWYASLARGRYQLTPQNVETIETMVKDYATAKDTLKALYQFLQRKTRYVAIHLGMGGYQPHDAESVLNNGYGDCKDLATLFIAMLKVVGMEAYPALILTQNKGTVLADFPSNQFNHVIAFVPLEKETLWLDCTCNYCSIRELPWWDEGCQALVVMKDTSMLIRTPTSKAVENKLITSIHAKLSADGSMEITGTLTATGNIESYYREILNSLSADKKKEWLGRAIGKYAPNYALSSYDLEKITNSDTPFGIGFSAKLIKYTTITGKELLINLNLLTRVAAEDIPNEKERKYPVDNQYAFTTVDEVTCDFPENLVIKAFPQEQDVVFPFGSYQTRYIVNGNQLTYKRTKTITQRLIEPVYFEDYKEFLNRIYTTDRSFVVLKRAE